MPTYNEVLSQVQSLSLAEQRRLLQELTAMVGVSVQVEGDEDEIISAEEIAESEAAWQDYQSGRDPGKSLEEIELELFGRQLD